jgi:hypothetical protein
MVKTTVAPKVAKQPVQTKTKATSKKVVQNKNIAPSALQSMTVAEVTKNIERIDYNAVDYAAMPWVNKAKKASEMFVFVGTDGKEHIIAQGVALAMADSAKVDPIALSLQLIAYQRGNPHAK